MHNRNEYAGVEMLHHYSGRMGKHYTGIESRTMIFCFKGWFVQYRISYAETDAGDAALLINEFVDQLTWPT